MLPAAASGRAAGARIRQAIGTIGTEAGGEGPGRRAATSAGSAEQSGGRRRVVRRERPAERRGEGRRGRQGARKREEKRGGGKSDGEQGAPNRRSRSRREKQPPGKGSAQERGLWDLWDEAILGSCCCWDISDIILIVNDRTRWEGWIKWQ